MRYIYGGSLRNYIKKDLKWEEKIKILYSIIKGLNSIHQKNLIHHNFHSGNILTLYSSNCRIAMITDLGLSGPVDQESSDVFGVLPYIAPEVLKNGNKFYTQ